MSKAIAVEIIATKIMELRGRKVMLDRDLAKLYGVAAKVLNQAVKRNIKRFPEDFMFQLSWEEVESLRSQFVTLKKLPGFIPVLKTLLVGFKGRFFRKIPAYQAEIIHSCLPMLMAVAEERPKYFFHIFIFK